MGRIISQGVYTVSGPFHPFGGAVDIVVVEQQDGTFKSAPWYVRFGKFQGVLKAKEKVVDICVNGVQAGFQMHLDSKGEAFFLREIDEEEEEAHLMFPCSSGDDTDDHSRAHALRSKSCDYDSDEAVGRTSSRQSRILGLVFGRRSLKQKDSDGGDGGRIGIGDRVGSLERAEIAANLLDLKWSTNLTEEDGQNVLTNSSGDDDIVVENGEVNEETCFDGKCDLNGKEVVDDIGQSEVQVACVKVELVEKEINGEEVSGASTIGAPDNSSNDNSEEDTSADGVSREKSETSKLGMDCSGEQAHEVMYLAGPVCEEVHVHVHDEVLHGAALLISEVNSWPNSLHLGFHLRNWTKLYST